MRISDIARALEELGKISSGGARFTTPYGRHGVGGRLYQARLDPPAVDPRIAHETTTISQWTLVPGG